MSHNDSLVWEIMFRSLCFNVPKLIESITSLNWLIFLIIIIIIQICRKQDNDSKINLLRRRVNVRPEVIFLKVCLKGWPIVGIWEFGFQEDSHRSLQCEQLTVTELCVQEMWLTLSDCVSTGNLELMYMLGRGDLSEQPPNNSGHCIYFLVCIFIVFHLVKPFKMRYILLENS